MKVSGVTLATKVPGVGSVTQPIETVTRLGSQLQQQHGAVVNSQHYVDVDAGHAAAQHLQNPLKPTDTFLKLDPLTKLLVHALGITNTTQLNALFLGQSTFNLFADPSMALQSALRSLIGQSTDTNPFTALTPELAQTNPSLLAPWTENTYRPGLTAEPRSLTTPQLIAANNVNESLLNLNNLGNLSQVTSEGTPRSTEGAAQLKIRAQASTSVARQLAQSAAEQAAQNGQRLRVPAASLRTYQGPISVAATSLAQELAAQASIQSAAPLTGLSKLLQARSSTVTPGKQHSNTVSTTGQKANGKTLARNEAETAIQAKATLNNPSHASAVQPSAVQSLEQKAEKSTAAAHNAKQVKNSQENVQAHAAADLDDTRVDLTERYGQLPERYQDQQQQVITLIEALTAATAKPAETAANSDNLPNSNDIKLHYLPATLRGEGSSKRFNKAIGSTAIGDLSKDSSGEGSGGQQQGQNEESGDNLGVESIAKRTDDKLWHQIRQTLVAHGYVVLSSASNAKAA